MTMYDVAAGLERATGVKAPRFRIPMGLLFVIAAGYEAYARLTGRPVLISLASVRLLARENERSRMNHDKSQREIGVSFRPFDETLADTVAWYRNRGDLPGKPFHRYH